MPFFIKRPILKTWEIALPTLRGTIYKTSNRRFYCVDRLIVNADILFVDCYLGFCRKYNWW